MKKDEEPIVVEQDFDRSASDVWAAITEVGEMRQWYFDNIPDFKAEVGFCTRFTVDAGDRSFVHLWEVTEVVPQRKLVYNWKYEGLAGELSIRFEVREDARSTHLRLTCRVLEDFAENIPEFARESGVEGWTYFIEDQLKTHLDG